MFVAASETPVHHDVDTLTWPGESVLPVPSGSEDHAISSEDWPGQSQLEYAASLSEFTDLPHAEDEEFTFAGMLRAQWAGLRSDYAEFYSPNGLTWLTVGLGAGALMANTGFDEHFLRNEYLETIVIAPSDELYELLHEPKFLGDGRYTIPAFAILAIAEPLLDNVPLGPQTTEWGQRSLRTILVGGPPVLGLQLLTGGSRPGESSAESQWKPFQDDNGVSGHSFMGAVPFLSAAKMSDDVWLKGGCYLASALPALSRINDDDHYFSQAFLGWWLAYLSASAVDRSHRPDKNLSWSMLPQRDGLGIAFEFHR